MDDGTIFNPYDLVDRISSALEERRAETEPPRKYAAPGRNSARWRRRALAGHQHHHLHRRGAPRRGGHRQRRQLENVPLTILMGQRRYRMAQNGFHCGFVCWRSRQL